MEPFEVIKALDHSLKSIGDLKKAMIEAKGTVMLKMNEIPNGDNPLIRSKEKELLKALRVLFQHSCHALMMVIVYRFRVFWCDLYHLSDAAISLYKLTTSKKDKAKDLKARKQSNGEMPMLFQLEMNGKETMVTRLKAAYDRLYTENKVRRPSLNGKVETRSKKRKQETEPMYSIPQILLEIEEVFGAMASDYTEEFGMESQDSEMISDSETVDDDDVEMDENVDCNGKASNGKRQIKAKGKSKVKRATTRKQPVRKTRKTRRKQQESSDEETEEEEIEYAETTSDEKSDSSTESGSESETDTDTSE